MREEGNYYTKKEWKKHIKERVKRSDMESKSLEEDEPFQEIIVNYLKFKFKGMSKSGKTELWIVHSKKNGEALGLIQWYSRWRCYALLPLKDTLFNDECLKDIS